MVTVEALEKIFTQLSHLTTSFTAMSSNMEALRMENNNRIKEIEKIAKLFKYSVELETDKEGIITKDDDR